MASTSETGHAKNVSNFDELVSFVAGYGTTYNPSKASIKLTALQTLSTNAKNAISAVNSASPSYSNAVAARESAFESLSKLTTRIINALKATDATPQIIDSAKTIIRKIQGKRATSLKTEEEKTALIAEGKEAKEISTSQMSYDNRIDNLDKLIKLLTSETIYTPNESDLKIAALTTLYTDLKTKNAAVLTATIPLSNSRLTRNDVLYKANTGLVDIAMDTKSYIKSIFGATSPQYKQVSKLAFKAVKV
jgi:hypothetical protein